MLPLPSVFCPAEASGTYDDDDNDNDDGTDAFRGQLQQHDADTTAGAAADDDDTYTAFPPLLGEKPRMPTGAGQHHVQLWWQGLSATLYKLAQRMHQAHHASSKQHNNNESNHHRRSTSSASHVFYVGDQHDVVLPVIDAVIDLPIHHDGKKLSRNRSKTRNSTDDALLVDSYPSLELTVPGSSSDETSGVRSRQAVNDEDDASDDDASTSTSSSMSLSISDDDDDSEFSSSDDECRRCSHSNNNDSDYFGDLDHGMSSGADDADEAGHSKAAVADLTSTSFSSDEEEQQEEMEIYRLARLYRQRHGIRTCVAAPKSSLATVRVADNCSWTGADGLHGSTPASFLPPPQVRQHPPPHRLRRRRRHRSCSKATSSTTTSAIVIPDLDRQLTARFRRSGPPVRSSTRRHPRRLAPSVSPSPMPPTTTTRKSTIKARPVPAASPPASAFAPAVTKELLPLPPLVGMRPRVDEDHTYLYISDPDDSDDDDHLNGHQDEKGHQHQPQHQDDGDGSSNSPFDPNHAGAAQLEFMSKVTRSQQLVSRPSHSPPPACFWPALSTWFQKHSSSAEHSNLWVVPPPTPSPGPMMPH